jgi:hypothetical protein
VYLRKIDEIRPNGFPISLVDYICYRNSKSALQEIRVWLGDEKFISMLNLFAGSYILFPPSGKLTDLYYDYLAAVAIDKINKAKKNRDLAEWNSCEATLQTIARRANRRYRTAYIRGMKVLRKLEKISEWIKKMEIWRKKFLGAKDGRQEGS